MAAKRSRLSLSLRSLLTGITLLSVLFAVWVRYPRPEVSPWSGERIPAIQHHAGKFKRDGKREQIKRQYIFDEQTLASLWQTLGEAAEPPVVDFSREMVLVGISPDANHVFNEARLDGTGNLRVSRFHTAMHDGKPVVGHFAIDVISTDGIWMIEGWPLLRYRWPYYLLGLVLIVLIVGTGLGLVGWAAERMTRWRVAAPR